MAFLRLIGALGAAALSLHIASLANAAPGDLDPGFGAKGTTNLRAAANDLAADAGGGTLVVSAYGYLARVLPSGARDPDFGRRGYVRSRRHAQGGLKGPFGVFDSSPQAVAIQPDGRIVIAGSARSASSSRSEIALARYLPDGTLDPSFSRDGVVKMGAPDRYKYPGATDVEIQPDGTIVGAGDLRRRSDFIARWTATGVLDRTFAGDGLFTLADPSGGSDSTAIASGPDGSVYGVGTAYSDDGETSDMQVVRLDAGGALDPAFDSDGTATVDLEARDQAGDIGVQADGNVVIAGTAAAAPTTSGKAAFARLTPIGTLDPAFSTDGKVVGGPGSFGQAGVGVIGLGLAGEIYAGGGSGAVLALRPDGEVDESFGSGGVIGIPPYAYVDTATGLAIAPDGKLLVAGSGINFELDDNVDTVSRILVG